MSEKKNLEKNIFVIPTEKVNFIKEGFTKTTKEEILKLENLGEYKLRISMEEDENYQQFIPYIAIKKDNKIFTYQRSKKGGDSRLFDKWTLGLGGHIDEPDIIISTAIKEIEEEVGIKLQEKDLNFVGFINLTETAVDRVHIGIAIIVEIPDGENLFNKGEFDKITNREFNSKEELEIKKEKFELWSKIFYEEYLKNILK